MTYALLDAQTAGYELVTDGDEGVATKDGAPVVSVTSPVPLFFLLVNIAEREGHGFLAGYGGDQELTAALVAAVSGETYTPPAAPPPGPPADPLVPASLAVTTAVAAAIATVAITSPNLTSAQRSSIKTQVQAQVQAVVDAHFDA